MRVFLDRFILGIPVLFIKQFPYAWIAAVTLWTWPPIVSFYFLCIILLGLLMLRWQSSAWISNLRREYAFADGKFYVDHAPFSASSSIRKMLILLAGSGLIAWLLRGQFGLGFWQIFLIVFGFTILYRDTQFFGSPATYIITDRGIGIRFVQGHLDYRLFFPFREISRIERSEYQKDRNWDFFARNREIKDGLLMLPKNPNGFTRRIEKLFIAPKDREEFLQQLPFGFV